MKNKFLIILLLLGLNNLSIYGQYSYKKLPSKYLKNVKVSSRSLKSDVNVRPNNLFDLTTLLPQNFVKDGSVDYTKYIQAGLDQHRNVLFPNFKLLINESGLTIKSNSNLYFGENTKLLMNPNGLKTYEILRLHNLQNVNIYNPVIIGDREQHLNNDGEWGMGIAIRSSVNINIVDPSVSSCWGDGIYIGGVAGSIGSDKISVVNAILDKNRRNGISITNGTNIKIIDPIVSNTYGTMPMYGIDIEPNSNSDIIDNILIQNPITFNNSEGGIVVGLGKLIGKDKKNVNVTIVNHIDELSKVGFYMGGFSDKRSGLPISGQINIVNPTWDNNVSPFKSRKSFGKAPSLQITKPKIVSPLRRAFTVDELKRITSNNSDILVK